MASIPLNELIAVRDDYKDLPENSRPENPSGQCAHKDYSYTEALASPIYKGTFLTPAEVVSYYNKITQDTYKEMTEKDFFDFINVALNLRKPTNKDEGIFVDPADASQLCADWATARPSQSSKVPMRKGVSTTVGATPVPISQENQAQGSQNESTDDRASAIRFYIAWLTRFAVKSPSAALGKQYDKVRDTYLKFYHTSSAIFDEFRPSIDWLNCLRNAFDSFPRVKHTLVLYVARAETFYKLDPKVFNILRYLFFQNMEFMGMHAYVSIVSIMSKIALPPSLILTWLRISGAEMAMDEAFMIMSTLDNGMIDGGAEAERLWKYARLLDPGYFNRLQTSYATGLMSTLAWIEIKLGISQASGYQSPLNIFAIANNSHIKDIGRAKAEAFIECINGVVSQSKTASVVDRIYAKKKGEAVVDTTTEEGLQNMDVEVTPVIGLVRENKRPRQQEEEAGPSVKKLPPKLPPPPVA